MDWSRRNIFTYCIGAFMVLCSLLSLPVFKGTTLGLFLQSCWTEAPLRPGLQFTWPMFANTKRLQDWPDLKISLGTSQGLLVYDDCLKIRKLLGPASSWNGYRFGAVCLRVSTTEEARTFIQFLSRQPEWKKLDVQSVHAEIFENDKWKDLYVQGP